MGLPIACDPGETCHIQQYVDADPGPGAQDYRCGTLSYEGHKGTDFALTDLSAMVAGVDVLAAAPGVVAAQGDARCGPDEWSLLAPPQAPGGLRFGARPALDAWPDVAGASVAAARVAGLLAALRGGGLSRAQAETALQATARFLGPERRTRPSA